jgi:hypothetical protein
MTPRLPLALVVLLAATGSAGRAQAYCRTSACDGHPAGWKVCAPAEPDDCGLPLYRVRPKVTYSVQRDASTRVSLEETRDLVRAAFHVWTSVDCGGGQTPRVELVETEPVACRAHEYNPDAGNANIILYREDGWDYDASKIAVTTVTHVLATGEIYDADLELNAFGYTFTTGDTDPQIDLPSVLTHEIGHFLGLAHSTAPGSTMQAIYPEADPLSQRSLTDDDRAGICAVYPPGEIRDACDATPRHGFSPLCAAAQGEPPTPPPAPADDAEACCCAEGWDCEKGVCSDRGGCALAAGRAGGGAAWPAALLLFGAIAARRRRP